MTEQVKYAEKIAKLLAKAESTTSQHEADAFISKAQQLMTTYAIDEAMLSEARGANGKEREQVIEVLIDYLPPKYLAKAAAGIAIAIAGVNNCKVLVSDRREWAKKYTVYVIGFESDVSRVQMLDSSVRIQMQGALNAWRRGGGIPSYYTGPERGRAAREFVFGYVDGLRQVLHQAKKAGQEEAVAHEAERQGSTPEAAGESVALVLRSRRDQVNDWVDEKYGKSLRSGTSRSYMSGGRDARDAGRSAGQRANISTAVRGGGGNQLTR